LPFEESFYGDKVVSVGVGSNNEEGDVNEKQQTTFQFLVI
jgi:hypothetical protein